jgi:flagella basal body P-ring formation protein FlgA
MNTKHVRSVWIPALLLLPTWAMTQPLQAPGDIQSVAEEFLAAQLTPPPEGQVFVSADALDPRLRLQACESRPTGLLPAGARIGARATVGVRCANPKWTVYVPVRVETELPVLVLRRALDRNSPLSEADVERTTMRVPGLSASYISSVEELAGRHLRRESMPGTALTVDLLIEDVLVRHGQRVTLVASAGGLEVRAPGEAITDAGPTGRVRVLNLTSRRIVEGQVESREVVRVSL